MSERKLVLRIISGVLTLLALLLSAMHCSTLSPAVVKDLAEDIAEVAIDIQDIKEGKDKPRPDEPKEPCDKW